ncbi:unnamed protein product [Sphagnum balticum]
MCWVVISPISTKISKCYNVSDGLVTLVPMLYMIMYLFVNFPSNWILDTKGIRKGVIIGAVMTALGAGIRCMVNLSFTFVVVGQVFCAIGQPFILNAPAKIATFWFKEHNVFVDISLAAGSNCRPLRNQHRGLGHRGEAPDTAKPRRRNPKDPLPIIASSDVQEPKLCVVTRGLLDNRNTHDGRTACRHHRSTSAVIIDRSGTAEPIATAKAPRQRNQPSRLVVTVHHQYNMVRDNRVLVPLAKPCSIR